MHHARAGRGKIYRGAPEITAYLSGVNEFSGAGCHDNGGIQNSGTSAVVFTNQGTLTPADVPTTAKFVTVGLSSGGSPINIKTDPQNLGDLPSPGIATASFAAKITSDATLGEYTLPLTIQYQYLSNSLANQPTSETLQVPVHSRDPDDPAHHQNRTGRPDSRYSGPMRRTLSWEWKATST